MRPAFTLPCLALLLVACRALPAQPDLLVNSLTSVSSPVDITGSGDNSGRLFLVEKAGRIRIFDLNTNTLLTGNFLNINTLVSNSGEKGLLGLAFHPNFASNGYFYVNYVHNGTNNTRISRFKADPPSSNTVDPATELILLSVPQPFDNHKAGDLAFGPDGYLYIPLGDGGSAGDPGNRSQNPQQLLGKLLRIDVDNTSPGKNYAIPTDNPFVGVQSPVDFLDEIWALGLRNPWRIAFDRLTGDLYIADVGQGAWEEVNFQPAGSSGGENYGWRCYEGNHNYNTSGCGPMSNYDPPVFEYTHNPTTGGNSITGGFVYRGTDVPSLSGWYVLADFTSDNFWLLKNNGSGWVSDLQPDVPVVDIVAFGEDDEGELYVSSLGGQVYKISASPLPIELTRFAGSLSGRIAQLEWTTATEKNAAHFQVERQTAGQSNFEPLGTLPASGESTLPRTYFFQDPYPATGENRYRLDMVDRDGQHRYSPVVSVLLPEQTTWQLSPNPGSGTILLSYEAEKPISGPLQIDLTDAEGKNVFGFTDKYPATPYKKELNLARLPAGVYLCRVEWAQEQAFLKLVLR